jgi:putative FmdB family regulatory protein
LPNYDYECNYCGHRLEIFHLMSAEDLEDCPECKRPDLIKLISAGLPPIIKGTENPCRGRRESQKPKRRDRLGEGKNKGEKPFWRDGPVDKNVLKNPKRYIEEGEVG